MASGVTEAAREIETKILERVSRITLSADEWVGDETAAEVSFGEDEDVTGNDEVERAASPLVVPCTLVSSPLRARNKRKDICTMTPTETSCGTPRVSHVLGDPRRKKRRMADAPLIPNTPHARKHIVYAPYFSPFRQTIYDERLETLAQQTPPSHIQTPVSYSMFEQYPTTPKTGTKAPASDFALGRNSPTSVSPLSADGPVDDSWLDIPRVHKTHRINLRQEKRRSLKRSRKTRFPYFPCLSPKERREARAESRFKASLEACYSPIRSPL